MFILFIILHLFICKLLYKMSLLCVLGMQLYCFTLEPSIS